MRTVFLNYLVVGICMIPVILVALLVLPRLSARFRARFPYLVFLILAVRLLLPWNVTLPEGLSWEVKLEETTVTLPAISFFSKGTGTEADAADTLVLADGTAGEVSSDNVSAMNESTSGEGDKAESDRNSGTAAEADVLALTDEIGGEQGGFSEINFAVDEDGLPEAGNRTGREVTALSILMAIWMLGMLFFLFRYIMSSLRLGRGLRRWKRRPGEAVLQCYQAVAEADQKAPELWVCPILTTPMVAGLFSPAIYLPHENYGSQELEMIFIHERTHLRRRDIWYKLVLFAARTIHWMNPFVWKLTRSAMANLEVSCDGAVVAKKDPQYRKAYGEMLLREATGELRFQNALTTCFSDEKTALKNRLEEVSNMKKRRNGTPFVAVALLIALLAGSGFTFESAEGMEEANTNTEDNQKDHSEISTEDSTEDYGDSSMNTDILDADGNAYSCNLIPLLDGQLTWGMAKEEAVEVLGTPTSAEESEYGVTYTWEYEEALESGLGDCSQLVLYIGENNLTNATGAVFSQGLMTVSLTVDGTTKETILESLESVYGTFSEESGSTALESQLKDSLPDYFNEYYFCDGWSVETLGEEDYALLAEVQEATSEWMGLKRPVGEGEVLADITLSGTVSDELYSCTVTITADYLTMLRGGF
ncbi:MAG: M56 family metallopeptidase [Lachnospiraceae bacterium]|nr:M56 family metallopeptidase [Lachnospiraceae bacterium]